MEILKLLHQHNTWANHQVLAAVEAAPAGFLETVCYDGETTHLERIRHWAAVDRGFYGILAAVNATERPNAPSTIAEIVAYADESGAGLIAYSASLDEASAKQSFYVPWWEREFEVQEGLMQVYAHSTQHRSEIAWELAGVGVDTSELDFIVWTAGGRPAPGEFVDLPDD